MQPYTEQKWRQERALSRQQMQNCQNRLQRIYERKSTIWIEAIVLGLASGLLKGALKSWGKPAVLHSSRLRYTKLIVKESMKRFDCMFGGKK